MPASTCECLCAACALVLYVGVCVQPRMAADKDVHIVKPTYVHLLVHSLFGVLAAASY